MEQRGRAARGGCACVCVGWGGVCVCGGGGGDRERDEGIQREGQKGGGVGAPEKVALQESFERGLLYEFWVVPRLCHRLLREFRHFGPAGRQTLRLPCTRSHALARVRIARAPTRERPRLAPAGVYRGMESNSARTDCQANPPWPRRSGRRWVRTFFFLGGGGGRREGAHFCIEPALMAAAAAALFPRPCAAPCSAIAEYVSSCSSSASTSACVSTRRITWHVRRLHPTERIQFAALIARKKTCVRACACVQAWVGVCARSGRAAVAGGGHPSLELCHLML